MKKKQDNRYLVQARLDKESHSALKEKVKKEFTNIADVIRKFMHQYIQK